MLELATRDVAPKAKLMCAMCFCNQVQFADPPTTAAMSTILVCMARSRLSQKLDLKSRPRHLAPLARPKTHSIGVSMMILF